ncbi:MAG: septum formation initiator family protein [Treponema sp.]|nr:septum formation initiator family protein [Treponema sp.]
MRFSKYLIGIWASVIVYTLFSFFYGPAGLSAYNYLLSERERQLDNIRDLGFLNEDLDRTRNNLLYDHDTLLIHARQMGYGQNNERFVRIVGLGGPKISHTTAGSVYTASVPDFISDKYIKITALCVGLFVFSFLLMLEIIEKRSR